MPIEKNTFNFETQGSKRKTKTPLLMTYQKRNNF